MIIIFELFTEAATTNYQIKGDFDDIVDYLDKTEYEALDQWAEEEFGINSTYDSKTGVSTFQVQDKDLSKFEKAVSKFAKLVKIGSSFQPSKIKTRKAFDTLSTEEKLIAIWYNLTQDKRLQTNNIDELKIKAGANSAILYTSWLETDVGKNSDSGLEELPFKMTFAELKSLAKHTK